jgi:uncharacterized membrane protein HdeD (DUF308 family)
LLLPVGACDHLFVTRLARSFVMASRRRADLSVVAAGVVLVVLGGFFFLVLLDVLELSVLKYVAPILLVVVGVLVLMRGFNSGGRDKGSDASAGTFQDYHPRRPGGDTEI